MSEENKTILGLILIASMVALNVFYGKIAINWQVIVGIIMLVVICFMIPILGIGIAVLMLIMSIFNNSGRIVNDLNSFFQTR